MCGFSAHLMCCLPHIPFFVSVGIECSGIVTAVGSNVKWLVPGDEVMCMVGGCIGTRSLF
jgi:NADPH:quinone reductase-like Zn-dependent oxidoreductase